MLNQGEQRDMAHAFQEMLDEQLLGLNSDLLDLENGPENGERSHVLDRLLRRCHTLKGSVALIRRHELVLLIQDVEGLMLMIGKNEIHETRHIFNLLFAALDAVSAVIHGHFTSEHADADGATDLRLRIRRVLSDPRGGTESGGMMQRGISNE